MDEGHFDRWAIGVARALATRRRLLGTVAVMAAAGHDPKGVAAKSKKKRCPRGRKCGRRCCPKGQACRNPTNGACATPTPTNPDPICAGINSCCSTRQCGSGCLCQTTIEGGGFCYKLGAAGCGATCAASSECPDGVCVTYAAGSTCGENTCCAGRPAVCVPNASRCR